jgi:hypothetical protein
MKRRVIIDIEYYLNNTPESEIDSSLNRAIMYLANLSWFTTNGDAEVDAWNYRIEDPEAKGR